ncbi:hypothetical protein PG984_014946 [Apiospora sp. TS-2023a]
MKISIVLVALSGAVCTMARPDHVVPRTTEPTTTGEWLEPDVSAFPERPGSLDRMLKASLDNCLDRDRAQKCVGIEESVFLERAFKFLRYWKTGDYPHDSNNQTEKDLLIRLVEYQDVYQTLVTENEDSHRFPDNIVDLVRSAQDRATEEGAMRSTNARVLDALDIIYNDVCDNTKKSKVPRRVQEITDIIMKGLDRNYDNTPFDSTPEPCVCAGTFPCGLVANQFWDPDIKMWTCTCLKREECPQS